MTAIVWGSKGPAEANKSYDLDWSDDLAPGDTIASSSWAIVTTDGGTLTVTSGGNTSTLTQAKTSGGTLGFNYVLQNTVITALNETLVASVMLPIRAK